MTENRKRVTHKKYDWFGYKVGAFWYGRILYYRVIWDRDPSFEDTVSANSVEIIEDDKERG